jgi:hypothetical protein
LEPNSIGLYAAGSSVNPKYPLRNKDGEAATLEIDRMLASYNEDGKCYKVTTDIIINLIKACKQDLSLEPELWSEKNLQSALEKLKILRGEGGYLVVKRGRGLNTARRETQGILDSGENRLAPEDATTLFIFRNNGSGSEADAWWPQLRFPDGNYVLAFSFNE